jgi:DNA-binding cell septation regulator SpoVG
MEISEVQITVIKPQNGLIAFASIVLNGSIYLSSIGVHKKLDGSGYRLTYPSKKLGNQNINIFHPINKTSTNLIEKAIFNKLKEVTNKGSNNAGYCSNYNE